MNAIYFWEPQIVKRFHTGHVWGSYYQIFNVHFFSYLILTINQETIKILYEMKPLERTLCLVTPLSVNVLFYLLQMIKSYLELPHLGM